MLWSNDKYFSSKVGIYDAFTSFPLGLVKSWNVVLTDLTVIDKQSRWRNQYPVELGWPHIVIFVRSSPPSHPVICSPGTHAHCAHLETFPSPLNPPSYWFLAHFPAQFVCCSQLLSFLLPVPVPNKSNLASEHSLVFLALVYHPVSAETWKLLDLVQYGFVVSVIYLPLIWTIHWHCLGIVLNVKFAEPDEVKKDGSCGLEGGDAGQRVLWQDKSSRTLPQ